MSVNPFPLQLSLIKGKKSSLIDDDDMNLQKRGGAAGAAGAAGTVAGAAGTAAGAAAGGIGGTILNAGKELLLEKLKEEKEGQSKEIPPVDLSTGTSDNNGVNDKDPPVDPDERTLQHPVGVGDRMKNSFFAHSRYPRNPDFRKFLPAAAMAAAPAVIGAIGEAMKPPADIPKIDLGNGQASAVKSGDGKPPGGPPGGPPMKRRVKTRSGTVIY